MYKGTKYIFDQPPTELDAGAATGFVVMREYDEIEGNKPSFLFDIAQSEMGPANFV